ncbi:MAG: VWA domain-containing protein [Minicystis sp.]
MTRNRPAFSALVLLVAAIGAGCAESASRPAAAPPESVAPPAQASAAPGAPALADRDGVKDEERAAPASMAAPAEPPPPPPAPPPAAAPAAAGAARAAKVSSFESAPAGASRGPAAPAAKPAMPARDEGRAYEKKADKSVAADPAPPPAPVAVVPTPSVKAGEWDDNANYREFQKWIGTEQGLQFHRVDVRDRQFIVVRDAEGKPVPRCTVSIIDERGRKVALTTTASGRAILFPHAEGLAGNDFSAATICQNGTASARFSLAQSDGVVDLKLNTKRVLPATKDVDVAFILDTTGSMSEEIAAVKATLQKVASALQQANARVRIGLVEYKDRGDPFVTKVYPMSNDIGAFSRQVATIEASGGGDTPESMNEGVHVGLTQLHWSDSAVARLAFVIADAPPHLDYPNDFDYAADMREAAHKGVQLFTVAASGMDALGQVVMRQMAQYTGATNLFVLRGGAGPQSVGGGDPKSSCGGTQTQYASGNLDALIVQKITRELRGLDRDPLRIPGLRTDENAKPCHERLLVAE